MNSNEEQSLSQTKPLDISTLKKILEEYEKSGYGNLTLIHSNNYILNTEIREKDKTKVLTLIGKE